MDKRILGGLMVRSEAVPDGEAPGEEGLFGVGEIWELMDSNDAR
jgi:hypothetical protein